LKLALAMSDHPLGHSCVLPFDRDTSDFARGFEAGRLWALLRLMPDQPIEETVHVSNAEMLIRMSEATGRPVRATEMDSDWLEATFDAEGC
jgi:hypothetical protein